MKIIYVAHQLRARTGAEMQDNRERASEWVAFLAKHFDVAPVASWIILSQYLGDTPHCRERGLEIDCRLVQRCDELWLVGPRVSEGMEIESRAARECRMSVVDLVGMPMVFGPIYRRLMKMRGKWGHNASDMGEANG